MSVLVHAEVDGDRLDHDSLIHESLLILIGGDETTRHVISGGGWQLLADRDQWDRLGRRPVGRADRGRGDAALGLAHQEHGPHRHPRRRARRPAARGRPEAAAALQLGQPRRGRCSTTRSRFDIGRPPNEHVAFGFGTHFCLGNSLARLELRVMFEQLLARLPDLALVDTACEPSYRAGQLHQRLRGHAGPLHPDRPVRSGACYTARVPPRPCGQGRGRRDCAAVQAGRRTARRPRMRPSGSRPCRRVTVGWRRPGPGAWATCSRPGSSGSGPGASRGRRRAPHRRSATRRRPPHCPTARRGRRPPARRPPPGARGAPPRPPRGRPSRRRC